MRRRASEFAWIKPQEFRQAGMGVPRAQHPNKGIRIC